MAKIEKNMIHFGHLDKSSFENYSQKQKKSGIDAGNPKF